MRDEAVSSVRLPDNIKDELVERFGSLRGAIIALYYLQKLVDTKTIGTIDEGWMEL